MIWFAPFEANKTFHFFGGFSLAQALEVPNKIKPKVFQVVRCVQKGFQHIPKSEKRPRRLELGWIGGNLREL